MISTSREQTSDLPPELMSMEEIKKASLTMVPDERMSESNEKGQEKTGLSYLLVSGEALSAEENQNVRGGKAAKNFIKRFLDSKFIGPLCAVQMGLW